MNCWRDAFTFDRASRIAASGPCPSAPEFILRITLNFADAPMHQFVALWSKSTSAPFYCIEPWTALPNSFRRADSELILLKPGEQFDASMWIDISRTESAA